MYFSAIKKKFKKLKGGNKISYGKKNKRKGAIFAAHAHFYVQDSVINKKPNEFLKSP